MTTAAVVGRLLCLRFPVIAGPLRLMGMLLAMMATMTTYAAAQSAPVEDFPRSGSEEEELPLPTNLETDRALQVVSSPLRWGHLSLLSVSAGGGYDSNPTLQLVPAPTSVVSFSGLAVYSIRHGNFNFDLQYRPFVLITPTTTVEDFSANSVFLQITRRLGNGWSLAVDEQLNDSPKTLSSGLVNFNLNLGGATATGSLFLSAGRNLLVNNVSTVLTKNSGGASSWTFSALQSFIRISGNGAAIHLIPTQEAESHGGGLTWSRRIGFRDTIHVEGNYAGLSSLNSTFSNVNYFIAGLGWSHAVTPTIHFSADAGPGWAISTPSGFRTTIPRQRITARGSFQVVKSFRVGEVGLSFSRSDDFSGVISDSFNNRYELRVDRRLGIRWNVNAAGSYVQQQVLRNSGVHGEVASLGTSYFLARNWSVFAQGRYLKVDRAELFGPEKSVSLGVRWSWVPEKP